MDEHVTISTPEQIAFQYETAGIGSRFLASLLDHLILYTILSMVYCGVAAVAGAGAFILSDDEGLAIYLALAFLIIVIFLIFWGYFVIFETIWNGQTPGKRASKLRVIRRSGQPIGAGEAMIRNLVRLVDMLPGFYGIGLVAMFVDKEGRRLGDLAAGTIVIREGAYTRLHDVRVPEATASLAPSQNIYPQPASAPYSAASPETYNPRPTPPDPLPGVSLRELANEDYRLIREMLMRFSRGEMPQERAYDLATRLAYGVSDRIGHNFADWQQRGWDPILFLECILTAKEARGH
jgi:uncharacterized RDD family membrane protein YckC